MWEQAWTRYEADMEVRLDVGLKLGALMKMLPPKVLEVIKLKYVENEAGLTYDVLRRQVEFWLESLQASGPIPMDLSSLAPNDIARMSEEQLEQALCVLREKGSGSSGKGGKKGKKGGKKGKKGKKGGKGKEGGPPAGRKIAGNCWNCDKPGHTSQDCRQPRREGLKSLEDDDDDDDDDSDTDSDDESSGVAGLSLGCLDECTVCSNFVDISWGVPNFDDLYNVSQESASHLSDEAGESRNTCNAPTPCI